MQVWTSCGVTVAKINTSKDHWLSSFEKDFAGWCRLQQQEQLTEVRETISGLCLLTGWPIVSLIIKACFKHQGPVVCWGPSKHPHAVVGSPCWRASPTEPAQRLQEQPIWCLAGLPLTSQNEICTPGSHQHFENLFLKYWMGESDLSILREKVICAWEVSHCVPLNSSPLWTQSSHRLMETTSFHYPERVIISSCVTQWLNRCVLANFPLGFGTRVQVHCRLRNCPIAFAKY